MAATTELRRGRRRGRAWGLGIVAVLVLAAAAYWLFLRPRQAPATAAERVTAVVRLQAYPLTVSGPGTLQPVHVVTLAPEVSGRLLSIAAVGQRVAEGDVLATIDPSTYQRNVSDANLALQKAQASLSVLQANQAQSRASQASQIASARAAVDSAQRTLDSQQRDTALTQTLYDMGSSSAVELATAKDALSGAQQTLATAQDALKTQLSAQELQRTADAQDVKNAEIAVDQAQLTLTNAEADLASTTLRAPFAGVISAVTGAVGGLANSGTSNLLTLVDDSRLEIAVQIDETDIAAIRSGQDATVTVDARSGESYPAKVTQIAPTATLESNIPVFYVTVEMDNADGTLRGGMTGSATITTKEVDDAFLVPARAVITANGSSFVRVQQADGSFLPEPVTVVGNEGLDVVLTAAAPFAAGGRGGATNGRRAGDEVADSQAARGQAGANERAVGDGRATGNGLAPGNGQASGTGPTLGNGQAAGNSQATGNGVTAGNGQETGNGQAAAGQLPDAAAGRQTGPVTGIRDGAIILVSDGSGEGTAPGTNRGNFPGGREPSFFGPGGGRPTGRPRGVTGRPAGST